jgi:hypothetical protein
MAGITKSVAKARLANVAEEKRFWSNDGRYLNNLEELKAALDDMTDETFLFHANETKSDFSVWVREVIGDDKLGADLAKSATRPWAAKAVAERIKFLKSKAGTA